MRLKSALALAGLAVAVVGVTAVSAAERAPVHVMLVHLPDGSVEQLRYTGDVAPRVIVQPASAVDPLLAAFGAGSPFAMMDRISAEMDRQMAGMMHQAAAMARMSPEQLQQTTMAGAPGGATSFTFVSTTGGNGAVCSQSVRTVSRGDGKAPQVTRTSSGDCGAAVAQPHALTPTTGTAVRTAPVLTPAALPAGQAAPKVDPASI